MMHDNEMTSEFIKTVTKQPIVFTWLKFSRKIPIQRKPSNADGTENTDNSFLFPKGN